MSLYYQICALTLHSFSHTNLNKFLPKTELSKMFYRVDKRWLYDLYEWETNWEQNFLKMLTSPHVIASILRKCSETLMIRPEHFLKSSKIIKSIPFAATSVELWQKHCNVLFEGTQALVLNIFRTDSCVLYVLFSSSA